MKHNCMYVAKRRQYRYTQHAYTGYKDIQLIHSQSAIVITQNYERFPHIFYHLKLPVTICS